jgi:hypothetical protein
MPINMFFIVKNHWEPYFTDNLHTIMLRLAEWPSDVRHKLLAVKPLIIIKITPLPLFASELY